MTIPDATDRLKGRHDKLAKDLRHRSSTWTELDRDDLEALQLAIAALAMAEAAPKVCERCKGLGMLEGVAICPLCRGRGMA